MVEVEEKRTVPCVSVYNLKKMGGPKEVKKKKMFSFKIHI